MWWGQALAGLCRQENLSEKRHARFGLLALPASRPCRAPRGLLVANLPCSVERPWGSPLEGSGEADAVGESRDGRDLPANVDDVCAAKGVSVGK